MKREKKLRSEDLTGQSTEGVDKTTFEKPKKNE
jgi:hypothetical protein